MPDVRRALAKVVAVSALLAQLVPTSLAAECLRNPVLDQNFPDPSILAIDGGFIAYATNGVGHKVQTALSPDLRHWTTGKDALPRLPRWAITGWTWAPQAIRVGGRYLLYFTARDRQGGNECIGVATGTVPEGPFAGSGDQPLICQNDEGGSIDPAAFTDSDGSLYLVWKNDGNSRNMDTFLYLQPLSPDGVSVTGQPKRLLKQDLAWEGNLIEAPLLWKHDGRYVLLYSANAYSDARYAIGYAVADRIDGPYVKNPVPLLASSRVSGVDYVGPGGETIVTDDKGQDWIAFHSWSPDHSRRVMNIAPLDWQNGRPAVRLDCGK